MKRVFLAILLAALMLPAARATNPPACPTTTTTLDQLLGTMCKEGPLVFEFIDYQSSSTGGATAPTAAQINWYPSANSGTHTYGMRFNAASNYWNISSGGTTSDIVVKLVDPVPNNTQLTFYGTSGTTGTGVLWVSAAYLDGNSQPIINTTAQSGPYELINYGAECSYIFFDTCVGSLSEGFDNSPLLPITANFHVVVGANSSGSTATGGFTWLMYKP